MIPERAWLPRSRWDSRALRHFTFAPEIHRLAVHRLLITASEDRPSMAAQVVVVGVGTAGSKCVEALLESGASVRAVDFSRGQLDKLDLEQKFAGQLQRQQGDATNANSVAQFLAGAEAVILAFQGGGYLSAGKVDHGVKTRHLTSGLINDANNASNDNLRCRVCLGAEDLSWRSFQGVKVVAEEAKKAGVKRAVLISSLLVSSHHG